LMLNGGGRILEDSREIREDVGLREILPFRRMPSADARFGNGHCRLSLNQVGKNVRKGAT